LGRGGGGWLSGSGHLSAMKAALAATDLEARTDAGRAVHVCGVGVGGWVGVGVLGWRGEQREAEQAKRSQQLAEQLAAATAELATTKQALAASASNGSNGQANGAPQQAREVQGEVEKERKKAAMAKQVADSLAEKVKALEAQLIAAQVLPCDRALRGERARAIEPRARQTHPQTDVHRWGGERLTDGELGALLT
jgi:hypothetical protein